MGSESDYIYKARLKYCDEKCVIEICKDDEVENILTRFPESNRINGCEILLSVQLYSKHERSILDNGDGLDAYISCESTLATTSSESPVSIVSCESPVPTVSRESPVPTVSRESPVPTVSRESPAPTVSRESPVPIVSRESPVRTVSRESPVPTVSRESPVPTVKSNSVVSSDKWNSSVSSVGCKSLVSNISFESPVSTVSCDSPEADVESESSLSANNCELSLPVERNESQITGVKFESPVSSVDCKSPELIGKNESPVSAAKEELPISAVRSECPESTPTKKKSFLNYPNRITAYCIYRAYFSTANFRIYDIGQWIEEKYGEIWEICKLTPNMYIVDFKLNESLDKFIQCRGNFAFKTVRIVMERTEIKLEKRYKLAVTVEQLQESTTDQELIMYCKQEGYGDTRITRENDAAVLVHFQNEELKTKFLHYDNHMICGKKVKVEPYGEWQSFQWRKKNLKLSGHAETLSVKEEASEGIAIIEDLSSQNLIDVRAFHVLSPSEIWCSKASSDAINIFNEIDQFSQYFGYHNSQNISADDQMIPGGYYLARVRRERDRWYRVKLVALLNPDQVKIFCIDTGYTGLVKRNNLRVMPEKLRKYPGQVFRIKLAGIRPAAAASGQIWTKYAVETFRQFRIKDIDIQLKAVLSKRMAEDYSYEGSLYTYESKIEDPTTLNEQVIVEDLKEETIRKGLALRIDK